VTDLFALRALRAAADDPGVAVATVYLPGLDIVRERCRARRCDPFEVLEQMRRHKEVVDAELGATWAKHGGSSLIFVVGLPGRAGAGERGVLLAHFPEGEATTPVSTAPEAPLVAVAPTWLAAAGFTVDDRMTGPVAPWVTPSAVDVDRRRTRVAPARAEAGADELERDVLERLRSLGYVR
jgi:hypothetical protein